MDGQRDNHGRFAPGNRWGGKSPGRPPRNYSISHALAIAAQQPQSVDDDGNPLTEAQLAARWLWRIVRDGVDERKTPEGQTELVSVQTKDRMTALQTVLSRIEPEYKLRPDQVDQLGDDEAEQVAQQLDSLSDDELQLLEKIGMGKGKANGDGS